VIGLADVEEARRRLAAVIRPTPVVPSTSLSGLAGRPVLLKPEYRQRTGSFKIRGAYNFMAGLEASARRVVAGSAGNHAQGVALAASLTGRRATVFMPTTAALPKVDATRAYGADVRLTGSSVDDCIAAAREHAAATGAVLVPPFDDRRVIAGQGTIGLEIAEEAPQARTVVVPIGGGGLISGIAAAMAAAQAGTRVVGVEAAGAPTMRAALDAGRCVPLPAVATMADGIAVKSACDLTLRHVQRLVADVVTVTEEEISAALLLLLERAKAVVEPAGAVGLAAVLNGSVGGEGPVVVVLSGGNVDPQLLIKLIDHGLSVSGRYLVLRIVLRDSPGALASLTTEVARLGLNVLDVEHHRAGAAVAVDEVEVVLTLETRDPTHRAEVVASLSGLGYRVELVR
jgi:threonine dehydratase